VALGGSLHYRIHQLPGKNDHRMPRREDVTHEEIYQLKHLVRLTPGGLFRSLAGQDELMVNSLHGQGIARLADGLEPLARAPDGLVEAFAVRGARTFAYAVQWHPEWRCWDNPFYAAIFDAFGRACRQRMSTRLQANDLARSQGA